MLKEKFNERLRQYVREHISPTNCGGQQCGSLKCDHCFVNRIYASFKQVLQSHCIQIGSFPRYTAIRPLHDLDILYIAGDWEEQNDAPETVLKDLLKKIKNNYVKPTDYPINQQLQTHSITITFKRSGGDFSVDIVPAYAFAKNNFGEDMYKVPEVMKWRRGSKRDEFYKQLSKENKGMKWIKTDPRGYIKLAMQTNQENSDFRKTVKLIKAWCGACKREFKGFGLKSFHIEQVVMEYFHDNPNLSIFGAVFKFFIDIPRIIERPQITDRADGDKYIDQYIRELTEQQELKIIEARDGFLIQLEEFRETRGVGTLIQPIFYKRAVEENFLFDKRIPILIDDNTNFRIDGKISTNSGKDVWLSQLNNRVRKNKEIRFHVRESVNGGHTLWKVQNNKKSREVLDADAIRGEITEFKTKNQYESTSYAGSHYVECFLISKDRVCIARSKCNVIIEE